MGIDLAPVSLSYDLAPVDAGSRTEVDDMVGRAHGVLVMFDDEKRVTAISQISKNLQKFLIVARMKPDGRFIENVENTLKVRAELSCQSNALGFSPRESWGGAVEIEVIEAYFTKEGKALKDLGLNIPDDGGFASREFDLGEKGFEVANGEGVNFWNRLSGKAN